MKKNTVVIFSEITLAENSAIPKEIQLTRIGEFEHPWYGKFSITLDMLNQMCNNWNQNIRGIDLAIDLEHGMTNHQSEAAGWIKNLNIKNDSELWATISWTELGQEKISKKLYRYLSAEFDTGYEDPEDKNDQKINYGYVLLGAGLTNRPFVKKMEPTSKLSEKQREEKLMDEKLKEIELSNKALSQKLDQLAADNKKLSESLKVKEEEVKKLNEEQAKMVKNAKFDEMLNQNKVCEAQRDAWMNNDMVKFAENSNPIKIHTTESGSDQPEETSIEKLSDMEKKLDAEIEKLQQEKKLSYSEALRSVLSENKEIKKWYNNK